MRILSKPKSKQKILANVCDKNKNLTLKNKKHTSTDAAHIPYSFYNRDKAALGLFH